MQDENEDKIESPYINEEDQEIEYDDTESVADIVKKLKDKIKNTQKEKEEYLNNWQRERADFVNFKKDEDVRMTRVRNLLKESFVESLLPTLDSFSVAFGNKDTWEKVDENWRRGVEYIHQQLSQALSDQGVTEIAPNVGDTFDPNIHQSIEDRDTENESEKSTILQVIQKGYKIGDSVLRPARVITGK